uniref:Uncharacterized protein n=1 Tax=Nelumbo nucifera TaxID=4432 RepID=A0A822XLY4_NELNU|nr:TPA_asm: hypothetical protein HUJ06_021532 [Nelumbo nucifera]
MSSSSGQPQFWYTQTLTKKKGTQHTFKRIGKQVSCVNEITGAVLLKEAQGVLMKRKFECVNQRHDRISSKRKFDDYGSFDEDFCDLVSVRMKRDEADVINSSRVENET